MEIPNHNRLASKISGLHVSLKFDSKKFVFFRDFIVTFLLCVHMFINTVCTFSESNQIATEDFPLCPPMHSGTCINDDQIQCIEKSGCQLCFCADNLYKGEISATC